MNALRRKVFWQLDNFKGGTIKKHIQEIETILEAPFSKDANELKRLNLAALLTHATNSTPYYYSLSGKETLEDFPVINKKLVQDNFDSFKSDKFLNENLFKVATSGSTGVPFKLFHDKGKRKRNSADVIYFSKKAGYTIGNLLIELEVWRSHNTRSNFKNFLQNTIQFDISKLTKNRIHEFIRILSTSEPKNVLGFPSAMESICAHIDSNANPIKVKNIKSFIANSEYLNDYVRESVKRNFKCPIYSRYSSEELGILAHQTVDSGMDFQINWASYIVEVLDMNKNVPAQNGKLGRLVITDLFNYAMPLIRYDTGDVATFNEKDKRFLKIVEGRKMDMVFDTSGSVISSYVVYTKFYPYYHLLNQYQFLQIGEKEYHIKMNMKEGNFEYGKDLINSIKDDFGNDAKVTIELVDEIPPLASGKRKKVVNEYKKS